MKKALYPGSFDPITYGHLDIIKRASKMVDELHVVVADNLRKKSSFTADERVAMCKKVLKNFKNVVVTKTDDLIIRYAQENKIDCLVRGLRNITDYENEYQLYQFNRHLDENIETIVLFPTSRNQFVSSSSIKELVFHHGNIEPYIPSEIVEEVVLKLAKK